VRQLTGAWHVDLVAHSMGGLISRQYIDSLMPPAPPDNKPVVSHLVMLGTPNEGSPCAYLLAAAEGPLVSIPTLQLEPSFASSFNQTVTERNGVPFSILAGDINVTTCGGPDGDSVVPLPSALWTISDHTVVTGLLHTEMTDSSLVFTSWVLPHLAIGPSGSNTLPVLGDDARTHAPLADPHKKKTKSVCTTANGETPSLAAASTFSASTAGSSIELKVSHARAMQLSVFAPGATLTLKRPSGKTYKQITNASLFETFSVSHPPAGRWTLVVRADDTTQTAAYALQLPGSPLSLSAQLTVSGGRLRGVSARLKGTSGSRAKVRATVRMPSGAREKLTLRPVAHQPGRYNVRLDLALGKVAAGKATLPLDGDVKASIDGQELTTLVTRASACTI